jgi:large repetitive protein
MPHWDFSKYRRLRMKKEKKSANRAWHLLLLIVFLFGSLSITASKASAMPIVEILQQEDGYSEYIDDSAVPLVRSGEKIASLVDSYSNKFDLSVEFNLLTNPKNLTKSFTFTLTSPNTSRKDAFAAVEVYKNVRGMLTPLDYTEYNLSGKTSDQLETRFYTSDIKDSGLSYLYFHVGVFKNLQSTHYSDSVFFKIPILMTAGSMVMDGSYVLFTNESTNENLMMNTGKIDYGRSQERNGNLRLKALQMDANLPFKPKDIQGNLYKKSVTKSAIQIPLGSSKEFWTYDFENEQDKKINAKLLYSGSKVNVWVHNNEITAESAAQLGKEFDERIYPSVTNHFGAASDVDGDGKINLLCFDILDGYEDGGSFMGGYFNQIDVFNEPTSNKSEILYIDTYPAMGRNKNELINAYSTIAHELQHLVNHNQNVLIEGSRDGMDVWLDEAMSMAAEQVYTGYRLDERIDYYNFSPSIAKGHSLLYWDYAGDTLANYSLSYLFGQYVKVQAKRGDSIFKEIIQDPNNNYVAVENVVKKYIDPTLTFGKFSTHFRAALLLKESTGLNGFNGDMVASNLQPRLFAGTLKSIRGGGAVVVKIDPQVGFYEPESISSDLTYTVLSKNGIAASSIPYNTLRVNPVGETDEVISGVAYVNAKVIIKADASASAAILGEAATGSDGKFSISIPKQPVGKRLYVYTQNTTNSRGQYVTVVDKTPPLTPVVQLLTEKDWYVSGTAEFNSQVFVTKDGKEIGTAKTSSSGQFKVELNNKQAVGTRLAVYVTDAAGNKSPEAAVVVAAAPPQIISLLNVNDQAIEVSGKTDPLLAVFVKKGSAIIGKGSSDAKGDFKIKIAKQKAGTELTVYAETKGGKAGEEYKLTVTAVPAKPVVQQVGDHQTAVKGKAAAGLTIIVKSGSKILGEAETTSNGTFSVPIGKKLKAGTTLTVYALSPEENKSPDVKVVVVDKTAPLLPTVTGTITSKSTVINGKAEAGSSVYVYNGNKLVAKFVADSKGTFKGKLAIQKKGTKLTLYAKDKAGNKSKAFVIVVK